LLGRNPDDREGKAIQRDRPADNRRVSTELALPEPMRDDRDRLRAAHAIVVGQNCPSERGVDAERCEVPASDELAAHALGFPGASQVHVPPKEAVNGLKGASKSSEILEFRVRPAEGVRRPARPSHAALKDRQRLGMRVRNRPQHDRVEDAEDHRVGTDAERQRANRSRCKEWTPT
jgi:hypothetical protein